MIAASPALPPLPTTPPAQPADLRHLLERVTAGDLGRTTGRLPAHGVSPDRRRLGKRDLNTLAPRFEEQALLGECHGVAWKVTVAEMLAYVRTSFTPEEARAVELYLEQDASYDDIARVLGLREPQEAERMIRKLKERLRVRFRQPE